VNDGGEVEGWARGWQFIATLFRAKPESAMQHADVLIVGGGPAGAACATKLHAGGLDVLILEKAAFPRDKLCAGWITPQVLETARIDPADYAQGRVLQPFTGFRTGRLSEPSLETTYPKPVSYGIRRREFDAYLLERSGARVEHETAVRQFERSATGWTVDGLFHAPMLIGAGGHFCPVARHLNPGGDGRYPMVAAQEVEVVLTEQQQDVCPIEPRMPEIFFSEDLLGYGWCVRKGPVLNVGLGREDRRRLPAHVADFLDYLRREGKLPADFPERLPGHAYLLYGRRRRRWVDDGVLLIGDAAGLAYPHSGEGILPALESGLLAAETILDAAGDFRQQWLRAYEQRLLARLGNPPPGTTSSQGAGIGLRRWLGNRLLRNRGFTRHVLLNRWFLHTAQASLPFWPRMVAISESDESPLGR